MLPCDDATKIVHVITGLAGMFAAHLIGSSNVQVSPINTRIITASVEDVLGIITYCDRGQVVDRLPINKAKSQVEG